MFRRIISVLRSCSRRVDIVRFGFDDRVVVAFGGGFGLGEVGGLLCHFFDGGDSGWDVGEGSVDEGWSSRRVGMRHDD